MYKKFGKRILDFIISLIALIILSPVILIVAILVRIKLGSPVIFKQKRPGKGEKIFTLYKFRSMSDAKDENGNLLSDEKRLTKFGKILRSTSLDELPELFNILKGDMSIVGPRPLLIRYLPYYTEQERHRHDVRPGLTGLAQINGRNTVNWDDRFKIDLQYINNISLKNDLKIIYKTIKKVIVRENVLSGNKQILKSLDVERKENTIIKRMDTANIQDNEIIIKKYIEDLRSRYYDGDIKLEVERIYENMKKYTSDNSAIILGLYILSELKGFIWGYELNDNIHVNYFYITSDLRSKGYGTKMLLELEKIAQRNIELFVDRDNKSGYEFYLKRGFKKIEEDENKLKLIKIKEC